MIIDSHVHYGNSFWGNFSPEYLLSILGDNVDYAICSNLEGIDSATLKDEEECNGPCRLCRGETQRSKI